MDLYNTEDLKWNELKADDENSIQDLDHWLKYNMCMYLILIGIIGVFGVPYFKILLNKY